MFKCLLYTKCEQKVLGQADITEIQEKEKNVLRN